MLLAGIINCMSTSHLSTGVIHAFTITALTQQTHGTYGIKTLFAILSPRSNNYHHSSRLVITMSQRRINITALSGRGGGGGSRPLWLILFGMRGSIIKLSIILYLVRVDI